MYNRSMNSNLSEFLVNSSNISINSSIKNSNFLSEVYLIFRIKQLHILTSQEVKKKIASLLWIYKLLYSFKSLIIPACFNHVSHPFVKENVVNAKLK